jgi:hypothetical protein
VTERRERKRKQLLDDLKEKRGYCKLNEEALDRTLWRIVLGKGCGPVLWQTAEWMGHKHGVVLEFICVNRIPTRASYYRHCNGDVAVHAHTHARTHTRTFAGRHCNTVQSLFTTGGRLCATCCTACKDLSSPAIYSLQTTGKTIDLIGRNPSVLPSIHFIVFTVPWFAIYLYIKASCQ